jgi:alpha-D-ribose 1-methylphosphonate 5-phosphate C-P lyase
VNAANIRAFFSLTCPGVSGTTLTEAASVIQTRHRIPEQPLRDDQILVFQVPYPDPLVLVEPNAATRRRMHGRADYARLWVKLYEDMVAFDEITISHRYPTRINGHYIIDPSPIPRYDVPKLHQAECLYLFGAGREKRIYAVPPHTDAIPITFGDVPFRVEDFTDRATGKRHICRRCGANDSFLDEFLDDNGARVFQCSDAAWCDSRLTVQEAAE